MGRFVTVCALLLGLIGSASGQLVATGARPEFPVSNRLSPRLYSLLSVSFSPILILTLLPPLRPDQGVARWLQAGRQDDGGVPGPHGVLQGLQLSLGRAV